VDTKTVNDMKTIENTQLDLILNSEDFNLMFDFETEKKEIESNGWNYTELANFGKQLSKQIGE
jgi:hypothetical protein